MPRASSASCSRRILRSSSNRRRTAPAGGTSRRTSKRSRSARNPTSPSRPTSTSRCRRKNKGVRSLFRPKRDLTPLFFRKQVEQSVEAYVVEGVVRLFFDNGFGVICDARSRLGEHGEVVRSVADGQHALARGAQLALQSPHVRAHALRVAAR